MLPTISENLNIPRKPLALRTCAARCLLRYLSTISQPNGVFISARVSEFWLFSLHRFHVCLLLSKWRKLRSEEFALKFCFKLNKTAAETHRMLKEAFGEQVLGQARTFEWFKGFKDGRESVEGRKHSGRPSTCTIPEMSAKVREVILENRRQTIHDVGKFCCEVLRRMRENARRKRPEMWKNGDWLLHHDNAPAHTSLVLREFPTKNNTTTVPHPAYSPDLAPCNFYVFPKMILQLKGRRFVSIEEIKAESQQVLNMLTPEDFNECFQKWQNRCDRCIQAQGDYFEGDGGN